jgi:hypothetical protein
MREVLDVTPISSVKKASLQELRREMRSASDDLKAFRKKAYLK